MQRTRRCERTSCVQGVANVGLDVVAQGGGDGRPEAAGNATMKKLGS